MKKTLLASAITVAFGFSGVVFANDTGQLAVQLTGEGDNTSTNTSTSSSTRTSTSTRTLVAQRQQHQQGFG